MLDDSRACSQMLQHVGILPTCSRESKCFFMHLMATYLPSFTLCAFSTSEKVPSPFLDTRRYPAQRIQLTVLLSYTPLTPCSPTGTCFEEVLKRTVHGQDIQWRVLFVPGCAREAPYSSLCIRGCSVLTAVVGGALLVGNLVISDLLSRGRFCELIATFTHLIAKTNHGMELGDLLVSAAWHVGRLVPMTLRAWQEFE